MRIASWRWGGSCHAGTVSPCGREVTPLAVPDPHRGVLRLIQALSRGEAVPRAVGPRLPLELVQLCLHRRGRALLDAQPRPTAV